MFTAKVDTQKLNYLMDELVAETKKTNDEIILKSARTILGNLIAITPQGKRQGKDFLNKKGYISNKAFQNAKKLITSDVAKLFPTTAVKDEERIIAQIKRGDKFKTYFGEAKVKRFTNSLGELQSIHKRSRNYRGRVNKGVARSNMALTRTATKNQLKKHLIGKIGLLNAGWLRAANQLKLTKQATPKWITRHSPKAGFAKFKKSRYGLIITLANKVNYYPKDAVGRANQAVREAEIHLRVLIDVALKKNAQKINRKMRKK
jgi:hypothetical protein